MFMINATNAENIIIIRNIILFLIANLRSFTVGQFIDEFANTDLMDRFGFQLTIAHEIKFDLHERMVDQALRGKPLLVGTGVAYDD